MCLKCRLWLESYLEERTLVKYMMANYKSSKGVMFFIDRCIKINKLRERIKLIATEAMRKNHFMSMKIDQFIPGRSDFGVEDNDW